MTKTVQDALAEIQASIAAPKGRKNEFGGYAYRNAEDIIKAARAVAPSGSIITVSDRIVDVAGQIFVISTASLTFGGETITAEGGAMHPLQKKGMDASQITGAASSYARKYALQGLFSLDDGKDDPDSRDNRQENGNAYDPREEADALIRSINGARSKDELAEIWGAETDARKRISDASKDVYAKVSAAAKAKGEEFAAQAA